MAMLPASRKPEPRPRTRNNRTAIPLGPPKTLRELRLWHWFKAQAMRKRQQQELSCIDLLSPDHTYRYYNRRAANWARIAEWNESAVHTMDPFIEGSVENDARAKGYTNV